MKSRANVVGHPLHPIMVTMPLGLWTFSFVADLIYHFGWAGDGWKVTAFYCIGGGLVTAVPAIITGLIDYTGIRSPGALRVAQFHMILNLLLFVLFAVSFAWRWNEEPPYPLAPVILSGIAVLLLAISGWLGGELVSKYRVSVRGTNELGTDDRTSSVRTE